MEHTRELQIQLASKWSWNGCDQVYFTFQGKVLEDMKRVPHMVEEDVGVVSKGRKAKKKKEDKGSCEHKFKIWSRRNEFFGGVERNEEGRRTRDETDWSRNT